MCIKKSIMNGVVYKVIKIVLSVLFLICLAKMPYGYYQIVRVFALVGFVVLAREANRKGSEIEMIVFIALALLFQPFFKLALRRSLWNIVDLIVGIGLLTSLFLFQEKRSDRRTNSNPGSRE